MNNYAKLEDLLVYRLAVELSGMGWDIFKKLSWHEQKIIGDQFIRADDSVGANIAEGYGGFHYLDRIKF
jgi:four helix bundle protein